MKKFEKLLSSVVIFCLDQPHAAIRLITGGRSSMPGSKRDAGRAAGLGVDRFRQEWSANSFLSRVPAVVADELIKNGSTAELAAGETLIRQDEPDDQVYLLLSGYVKVISIEPGAKTPALLAIRVAGDIVGELVALSRGQRSASVQTCGRTATVVCELAAPTFREIVARHREANLLLSETIGRKLSMATHRRRDRISRRPPAVQMARVLVDLAEDHGKPIPGGSELIIGVDLNQIELGQLIGVSVATAHRAMKVLRDAGLIATSAKRRPLIKDLDGLRNFAREAR